MHDSREFGCRQKWNENHTRMKEGATCIKRKALRYDDAGVQSGGVHASATRYLEPKGRLGCRVGGSKWRFECVAQGVVCEDGKTPVRRWCGHGHEWVCGQPRARATSAMHARSQTSCDGSAGQTTTTWDVQTVPLADCLHRQFEFTNEESCAPSKPQSVQDQARCSIRKL